MVSKQLSRWSAVVMGALLVFGIARAANSHYAERRSAFYESQEGERKRLGLTDWGQVKAKYPTPEVTFCHAVRVAPGSTADLVVRGKFVPGTKFLFENDAVEVVKENATATEYHATVRVPAGAAPGYSPLHIFSAVSGIEASPPCPAVYFGGRYEWDFTAQNGWVIKLRPKADPYPKEESAAVLQYTAEFYRNNESKPFEVRDFPLGLIGTLYGDSYSGGLAQPQSAAAQGSAMADMQQLMQKLYDPNTSPDERAKLAESMAEAQQKMMAEQQAAISKMSDPKYAQQSQQQQQQKDAEFGCKNMNFNANADAVEGRISCGQNVGTITLKGTRRFLGP